MPRARHPARAAAWRRRLTIAPFTDGRSVVPFATELAVTAGEIGRRQSPARHPRHRAGGLSRRPRRALVRGDNPVLMTMELVLEVLEEAGQL